jgi:hypothetical protein
MYGVNEDRRAGHSCLRGKSFTMVLNFDVRSTMYNFPRPRQADNSGRMGEFWFMVYCPQGGLGVLPTIDTFYALTVYSHRLLGSFKNYPLTYLDSLWQKRIGRARCPHVLI